MSVKLISCKCTNKFQDQKYGQTKRIHNSTTKGWRCTVCGDNKV
jgi:hypothetical protein